MGTQSNLFIFSNFFFSQPHLYVWNSLIEKIGPIYTDPTEYKSIKNLKPVFSLQQGMNDTEIIEKLGGEEKVRKNAVTMDQIEQLIKNQWCCEAGIMLNNWNTNIFYVIGINDNLFAAAVSGWEFGKQEWLIGAFDLNKYGYSYQNVQVFSM